MFGDSSMWVVNGFEKCIADYHTGRQGICYILIQKNTGEITSSPCWYVDKNSVPLTSEYAETMRTQTRFKGGIYDALKK